MAAAALGGHDGAVPGAHAHADAEIDRLEVQASQRLDETKAGLLIIGEDMAWDGAAAHRGQPNRLGLGDQVADRQDQTVPADQYTAAGALGAERPGAEGVLRHRCPQAEDRTQGFQSTVRDIFDDPLVAVGLHHNPQTVPRGCLLVKTPRHGAGSGRTVIAAGRSLTSRTPPAI